VPNVASGPILGMQWVKSADGKHTYDLVVTENSTDANVPVGAALLPYNA
jgi:branched-chain amino acid transport system substrate-binding protein